MGTGPALAMIDVCNSDNHTTGIGLHLFVSSHQPHLRMPSCMTVIGPSVRQKPPAEAYSTVGTQPKLG